ncbi:uncharacterized protein si:ch211-243a20.4 isoform X2 [Engraulis encrasicolus]|uniref:uncharacterized protein si:ch211-243a20.4 isoform X2 n=1 Tax=Engraulis encrasicolus TaxID=184585 RepID=UPI002FD4E7C2
MSSWITVLCSVFLGLLGQTEGRATITLNVPHTHVVLAGQKLHLKFIVTVPLNTSAATLACYHDDRKVTSTYHIDPNTIRGQRNKFILFNNSSESGEYHCRFTHGDTWQNIYLAVLVQDKGFREMYHGLRDEVVAPVAAVTVFFLIFSVVGTICIYRSQAAEGRPGNIGAGTGAGTAGARTSVASATRTSVASGNAAVQAVDDEDGGANSVYTTLESRPTSIYDVLDPSVSGSRAQSKKSSRKRSKKQGEAASAAEDGIFESVYENL